MLNENASEMIQTIGKLQVRESDQLSYPVRQVASLDMVPERRHVPLLVSCTSGMTRIVGIANIGPLETGLDTHTHYAAIGALCPLRETFFYATALYT